MKPRVVSLALAVGLFVLALWFAFRPHGTPDAPARAASAPSPRATPFPPIASSPGIAPAPAPPVAPPAPPGPTPGLASSTAMAPPPPNPPGALPTVADASAAAAAATSSNPPPRDATVDANKVRVMFRDYHTLAGENPVGTNAEIMRAITGGNTKQATLGPPEGMSLNGQGELVDQWNTPYFFHQLSKDVMEIRSAGPDKAMYTADDILAR